MPKIEIPGITFAYLIEELRYMENALVTKVQELPNDWIRIRLLTKNGQRDLVFTDNAFFSLEYAMQAKQQTSGFGAFLNKYLKMKRLLKIEQLNFERVFLFHFGSSILIAELFSKGNLILLDEKRDIMMPKRYERWSSREIKKGLAYKEPPLMENPAELSFERFAELMKCDKKIVPALVKLAGVSPVIAEEACFVTKIPREKIASELSENQLKELYKVIQSFYSQISLEKEKVILIEHRGKHVLIPFELSMFKGKEIARYKSVNEALNELFVSQQEDRLSPKIAELKHSLEKQKYALQKTREAAELLRKKAELIYMCFADLEKAFRFAQNELKCKKEKGKVMYNKSFGRVKLKEIDFKSGKAKVEIDEEIK